MTANDSLPTMKLTLNNGCSRGGARQRIIRKGTKMKKGEKYLTQATPTRARAPILFVLHAASKNLQNQPCLPYLAVTVTHR